VSGKSILGPAVENHAGQKDLADLLDYVNEVSKVHTARENALNRDIETLKAVYSTLLASVEYTQHSKRRETGLRGLARKGKRLVEQAIKAWNEL